MWPPSIWDGPRHERLLNLRAVDVACGGCPGVVGCGLRPEKGSAGAILGRNGVGKTTLLKTIVGQMKLTKGVIFLNVADVSTFRAHERSRAGIGFVPQGRHVRFRT